MSASKATNRVGSMFWAIVASANFVTSGQSQMYVEVDKLTASNGVAGDHFGYSVSVDGGVIAVGAEQAATNKGSAYLYDAQTGQELHELYPSAAKLGDQFGYSISSDSGKVAVGSRNGSSSLAGSAGVVFVYDASTGDQLLRVQANDGANGDFFGTSVALGDGLLVVGATGANGEIGAAYVFDVATGNQLAKLTPNTGAQFDRFGWSVAVDNGIAVVGARSHASNGINNSGAAYLFNAANGAQLFKLVPSDIAQSDLFGHAVAIDGGIVAVGSRRDDDLGNDSGSVYLFNASNGVFIDKLRASDGAAEERFGSAVAMHNGRLVVGAHLDDESGPTSGSAYLFDVATRTEITKLVPSDGFDGDEFGWFVDLNDDVIVVGAYLDDDQGNDSGSVYVFDEVCLADTNGDGMVSPADFSAWVAAFNAMTSACDQNGDGTCSPADFSAWVANYNSGC